MGLLITIVITIISRTEYQKFKIEQSKKKKDKIEEKKIEEERRTLLNVDELITRLWKEEMPSVDDVESKLANHKQKLKEMETMYMKKKNLFGAPSHEGNAEENEEQKEQNDDNIDLDKEFNKERGKSQAINQ